MQEEKYKAGGYLYSIDWSSGGDKVRKMLILTTTKKLLNVEDYHCLSRPLTKKSADLNYFTSELDCLKSEFKRTRTRVLRLKEEIKECGKSNMTILKRIMKLKAKGNK